MRKIYTLICFVCVLIFLQTESAFSQCIVVDSVNSVYGFNDPSGSGTYSGFLCIGVDSLGTTGTSGYFDGDGYIVNLVAGSQVTFSVDSCTGHNVSLTINDSARNIIPGAYAGPACPNSLDFTAPYTGSYIVVINLNGTCGGGGSILLGEVYVKIKTGTTIPDCPVAAFSNDTICGAIALQADTTFIEGNTILAFPTDPLDGYIGSIGGDVCSPPNNTLWYSYTPPGSIDTLMVVLTAEAGGNFHSWLVVFPATNLIDPCNGPLTFLGCAEGPNDAAGIDTIKIPVYGLLAGHTYFFMIDGYNGSTGKFSIALESSGIFNTIGELKELSDFLIYPNPAMQRINIKSFGSPDAEVTILNSINQEVFDQKFNALSNEEIDISNFTPGLYLVKISTAKGTFRKKLIVNN